MRCLRPLEMFDLGVNPKTGKRILRAKLRSYHALSGDIPKVLVPCGKCLACKANRRKEWIARLSLQLACSRSASFVTLTYDDEHLPKDQLVARSDVQKFLKRFRQLPRSCKDITLDDFKYFLIAERGEKYGRLHYHAIFFGLDILNYTLFDNHGFAYNPWRPFVATFRDGKPIYSSNLLSDIWKNGFVSVDECNSRTINYCSAYVTKCQRSKDSELFYLCSIGLAKDYFVSDDSLSIAGINAFQKRFVTLPGKLGKPFKRPVPHWAYRYADRYAPSIFEEFKSSICDKAKQMPLGIMPHALEDYLLYSSKVEALKRKLDYDS